MDAFGELCAHFCLDVHPDVVDGVRTAQACIDELIALWDRSGDGVVSQASAGGGVG